MIDNGDCSLALTYGSVLRCFCSEGKVELAYVEWSLRDCQCKCGKGGTQEKWGIRSRSVVSAAAMWQASPMEMGMYDTAW